ncbi:MAG TPA: hypothetical protein VGM87_14450 [Roseomonas sp.]
MPSTRRLPAANPSLLGAVRAGAHDRILVIAASARAADVMGDAIRRGCRAAAAFVSPPAHPEPAEVVVAPRVETTEAGLAVAACARRALRRGGRLVMRAASAGAAGIVAAIRDDGFERVRLRAQAEGDLLLVCRRAGMRRAAR